MKDHVPLIVLRISIPHDTPQNLAAALPEGWSLGEEGLHGPGGQRVGLEALRQDDQFADIVIRGATHPPSDEEERAMRAAPTLLRLIGPGGSPEAAQAMLAAGAAMMRAGGSGVLVESSGASHGAGDWLTLAQEPEDRVHWALIGSARDQKGDWTGCGFPALLSFGMHCLGHRDVIVQCGGDEEVDYFHLHNTCGYLQHSGRTPVDGDVMTAVAEDDDGGQRLVPMFRVRYRECTHTPAPSPMHNPYGMYVLELLDEEDPESIEYRPSTG